MPYVLDRLAEMYGRPSWRSRRDGTAELILTILSQHTSDINAERAFAELRQRFPTWAAVEAADPADLAGAIRSGGLAAQKAPRIRQALAAIREARGDYDLAFLADWPALEARAWLTRIPGIGPKTASVVLLFCYGLPLMPIDTHVERVSRRIGLIRPAVAVVAAHDDLLRDIPAERVYEAHVNLITHGRRTCHARRPACDQCLVAPRCRYVDPRAA
jgi:endonuclease III